MFFVVSEIVMAISHTFRDENNCLLDEKDFQNAMNSTGIFISLNFINDSCSC
jgi:hypothetical protein